MPRRILPLALAVLAGAAACSSAPAPRAPGPAAPDAPRLVVLLVIDQWPAWAFAVKRPHLRRGFERLLREGAWHTAEYPSAATITAPAHALLGSGEPSATSGIVANEWYRRAHERVLQSIEDPEGHTTARWLRVPGLGDAIAAAKTGAKAVAVSLKDRAAILPLGHAGVPIWYDKHRVAWTSTVQRPWLDAHNRRAPLAARLRDRWTPLDPARLAALSGTTDDQAGEVGVKGLGRTFPHDVARAPEPADALHATPSGNQIVLDTALAALDGERLGDDATPDLLVISLSAHDYVGHGWGQESWEAWDMMLRLDEQLARFLDALDRKVGARGWAMAVTSDHGACPLPERTGGGRINFDSIRDSANRAAATALGLGDWIAWAKYPGVYLNPAARARSPADQAKALTKIVYALRSFPGMAHVERAALLTGSCDARTGDARLLCLALDPDESGDVVFMTARHWILQTAADGVATSHGSLHDYDREVPLLLLPPGRKRHAPATAPRAEKISAARVSAIVAGWLGVTPPQRLPRDEPPPAP